MSQENVEIVRRGYELFAANDLEGVSPCSPLTLNWPVARLLPELGGGLDPHEYGHDDRDRDERGEERDREHEPEPLQTPTKGV
jgi:hypothetical protein